MSDSERRQRVRDLLFLKVRQSRRKMRNVSRALGWPDDRLSRLLKGTYNLELDDIYNVLTELGCSAATFWAELEGEEIPESPLAAVLPEVPVPDPNLALPGGISLGEIEDLMRRVLRDELERLRRSAQRPPATPEEAARRERELAARDERARRTGT